MLNRKIFTIFIRGFIFKVDMCKVVLSYLYLDLYIKGIYDNKKTKLKPFRANCLQLKTLHSNPTSH